MQRKSWVPYVVLAAGDVILAGLVDQRARQLRKVTKPLLMPVLGLTAAPLPPLALAGLALSATGDVALLGESDVAFSVGLAAFLAAHGCYIAALGAGGGVSGLRRQPLKMLPAAALILWSAARLAPKASDMRWPVTGYGVVIGSMAALAAGTGRPMLTWGAAGFCLSDLMLASAKFGKKRTSTRFSLPQAAVMATYAAGQAMIISGLAQGSFPGWRKQPVS